MVYEVYQIGFQKRTKSAGTEMNKRRNRLYLLDFITDMVTVFISYVIAMYIRYEIMDSLPGLEMLSVPYLLIALIYSFVMASIFSYVRSDNRYYFRSRDNGAYMIFLINIIGCLFLLSIFYVLGVMDLSRMALVLFWGISSLLVIMKKELLIPILLNGNMRAACGLNVLIVGDGELAKKFIRSLESGVFSGCNLIGYIGNGSADAQFKKFDRGKTVPLPKLGKVADIEKVLKEQDIDEVIICPEPAEDAYIGRIVNEIKGQGTDVAIVPHYYESVPQNARIYDVGTSKFLDLSPDSRDLLKDGAGTGLVLTVAILMILLIFSFIGISEIQKTAIYNQYVSVLFAGMGFFLLATLVGRIKNGKQKLAVTKRAVFSWLICSAFSLVYEMVSYSGDLFIKNAGDNELAITATIAIFYVVFGIARSVQRHGDAFLF